MSKKETTEKKIQVTPGSTIVWKNEQGEMLTFGRVAWYVVQEARKAFLIGLDDWSGASLVGNVYNGPDGTKIVLVPFDTVVSLEAVDYSLLLEQAVNDAIALAKEHSGKETAFEVSFKLTDERRALLTALLKKGFKNDIVFS